MYLFLSVSLCLTAKASPSIREIRVPPLHENELSWNWHKAHCHLTENCCMLASWWKDENLMTAKWQPFDIQSRPTDEWLPDGWTINVENERLVLHLQCCLLNIMSVSAESVGQFWFQFRFRSYTIRNCQLKISIRYQRIQVSKNQSYLN